MDRLHALTVGDVVRENRRRFPTRLAVVCGEVRLSYPELDERVTRLADALACEGVGPGERVLWLGQNCHRVLELLLACSKLGAVLCPANWRSSPAELGFVLADLAPSLVVAQHTEVGPLAEKARADAGERCRWLWHDDDGPDSYEAFLAAGAAHDPERPVDSAASALMIYTAAFGGHPNGALLPSASLIGEGLLTAFVERLSHEDVFVVSGPLFHIGCWRYVLSVFLLGGTNVFLRRVDAVELCRLVHAERATHAYLFGGTQQQMVEANAAGEYDLSSLRCVLGSPEWNAMVSPASNPWLDRPQRYGQTEVGGIMAYGAFGPPPMGGHGFTSPLAQLRIFNDAGDEVPAGEPGEIAVRGPLVMNGYHNRPDLNATSLAGGWRRTHDIGRRETDGSITFLGPKTRMLKSGMENVYPAEVENALRAHPDVADCAVIGVPDPTFIQTVKAIVVPAEGRAPTTEELIRHARERLAHYKAPRSVAFVPELPRTGGAVDYAALDAHFGGGNYPGLGTRTS